jgi:hypothetical protein
MEETHTLGSGFTIRNFPTYKIPSDEDPDGFFLYISPDAEKRSNEIIQSIKTSRGEIISCCVDIDNLLGKSISRFFLKDDPKKQEIFHELILDTTELSFAQKRNILKLIMEKYPEEFGPFSDKKRQHEFFEIVNYIIKIRNALAHGEIIVDYNEDKVFLQYYDKSKNKKQEIELSPEFFKKVKSDISQLVWSFWSGISDASTILSDVLEDNS